MFKRDVKKPVQLKSNLQEEWQISVIEVLELDPRKYFKKPGLAFGKVNG